VRELSADEAALLKAICENPDEDTPRLVYADWLDEQGGESRAARAEFIRLQVAEDRKPGYHPNGRSLTSREHELLRKWNTPEGWKQDWPDFTGVSFSAHHFERGFPIHLYARSVRSFLKAAPALFSRVPATWVRFLATTPRTAGELARSAFLARIHYLDQLAGEWSDEILAAFEATPHLANLRKLVLGDPPLSHHGLRLFLANASLTGLTELMCLNVRTLGPFAVAAVTDSRSAGALESVCLQGCGLAGVSPAAAAAFVRLPSLRRLSIGSNGLGDEVAVAMAAAFGPRLTELGLSYCDLTDAGAWVVVDSPHFRKGTTRLGLHGNRLSDAMKARIRDEFGGRVGI
jgi:uncharacterized protein (TIGR02996 family)